MSEVIPEQDPIADPIQAAISKEVEPLREKGMEALIEERTARYEAERKYKDLQEKWNKEQAIWADSESLAKELSEAREQLSVARFEAMRSNVLRSKGVPDTLEKYVAGSTVEELEASATELLALFNASSTPPATGGQGDGKQPLGMRPDMTQGAAQPGSGMDVDTLISTAESQGDYKAALELKAMKLGQLAQTTN